MYNGRRAFRSGRTLVLLSVIATVLFAAGAFATHRADGWTWVSLSLSGLVVFGVAAIIETLVTRIELTDDALVITNLWGTRRFAMSEIDRVEEARGVSPAVRLTDGRWVRLPAAGSSVGNSVRAWLKQGRSR